MTICNAGDPAQAVGIDAFIDSGAEGSLFQGWIPESIGLALLDGERKRYAPVHGVPLEARLHRVTLSHTELGSFELELGFCTVEISRNLLGRDFLNLIQVGFRENQQTFFISPTP